MPEPIFFFDSHGRLWGTCAPNHPDACAFGPSGIARPASNEEAGLPEGVPFAVAAASGRLVRGGEHGEHDLLAASRDAAATATAAQFHSRQARLYSRATSADMALKVMSARGHADLDRAEYLIERSASQ